MKYIRILKKNAIKFTDTLNWILTGRGIRKMDEQIYVWMIVVKRNRFCVRIQFEIS